MYIKTPLLEIISYTDISICEKLGITILLSIFLGFICICLFKVLNYSIYCLYNNIKNEKYKLHPANKKCGGGFLGILWVSPLSECNNPASQHWAGKALRNQQEIRTISTVIKKLDNEIPHPSGSSRWSAFHTYLLERYKESINFDRIARKNQYRTMILNTPLFTRNDNISFPNSSSGSDWTSGSDSGSDLF